MSKKSIRIRRGGKWMTARALAIYITNAIAVNDGGDRADRLVLFDEKQRPPRNLGGWGYEPLIDRIESEIERHFK